MRVEDWMRVAFERQKQPNVASAGAEKEGEGQWVPRDPSPVNCRWWMDEGGGRLARWLQLGRGVQATPSSPS